MLCRSIPALSFSFLYPRLPGSWLPGQRLSVCEDRQANSRYEKVIMARPPPNLPPPKHHYATSGPSLSPGRSASKPSQAFRVFQARSAGPGPRGGSADIHRALLNPRPSPTLITQQLQSTQPSSYQLRSLHIMWEDNKSRFHGVCFVQTTRHISQGRLFRPPLSHSLHLCFIYVRCACRTLLATPRRTAFACTDRDWTPMQGPEATYWLQIRTTCLGGPGCSFHGRLRAPGCRSCCAHLLSV